MKETVVNIPDLLMDAKKKGTYLKVCAPMVRYSKVQFRTLVRHYGVDLCFTPMILANSFCQNGNARTSEFSTTANDTPLIAQFAANNCSDFLDATKLIYPYVDGVDLNCGCPQRWAMKDGFGCALLAKPELIQDLIKEVKRNFPSTFSVSVKIRILNSLSKTIYLCKQLESCGVSFITVHGRKSDQKQGESVDIEMLKSICELAEVPLIANGGVKTLDDAEKLYDVVKCNGVMSATGILANPALYSGVKTTPLSCVQQWIELKNRSANKITFQCYHHHLIFMLDKILSKTQRRDFNLCTSFESVDNFLYENIPLLASESYDKLPHGSEHFINCKYDTEITFKYKNRCRSCGKIKTDCECNEYDSDLLNGKYFSMLTCEDSDINPIR